MGDAVAWHETDPSSTLAPLSSVFLWFRWLQTVHCFILISLCAIGYLSFNMIVTCRRHQQYHQVLLLHDLYRNCHQEEHSHQNLVVIFPGDNKQNIDMCFPAVLRHLLGGEFLYLEQKMVQHKYSWHHLGAPGSGEQHEWCLHLIIIASSE